MFQLILTTFPAKWLTGWFLCCKPTPAKVRNPSPVGTVTIVFFPFSWSITGHILDLNIPFLKFFNQYIFWNTYEASTETRSKSWPTSNLIIYFLYEKTLRMYRWEHANAWPRRFKRRGYELVANNLAKPLQDMRSHIRRLEYACISKCIWRSSDVSSCKGMSCPLIG